LQPASIDALYYVVIDPSGRHGFTSDPQEFERLKQRRPTEVH
jgi:cell division protein YceG involved in septum cleavage